MSGEMMKERVDNIRADLRMFSTSRGSTLSPHLSAIWSRRVPSEDAVTSAQTQVPED